VALPFGVVEIRAEIISEPDALGRGFAFAPRLLTALDAFAPLNLGQPGSLYTSALRLKLAPGQSLPAAKAAFEKAFPEDGTALRDRARSADGLETLLERLELFLSCVGFAALLAGGLGVRGAVAGYLEGRRGSIAVLKTLGASAGDIRLAYGLQIAALASLGALIGVALGAATPFLIAQVFGAALPIPIALSVYPQPLWAAAAAGLLAAAAFALWPLGAARATAPTELFRGGLGLGRTPWLEQAAGVAALLALAGVFALTSPDPVRCAAGRWRRLWRSMAWVRRLSGWPGPWRTGRADRCGWRFRAWADQARWPRPPCRRWGWASRCWRGWGRCNPISSRRCATPRRRARPPSCSPKSRPTGRSPSIRRLNARWAAQPIRKITPARPSSPCGCRPSMARRSTPPA
jgi:putative ABC transport system permease protein